MPEDSLNSYDADYTELGYYQPALHTIMAMFTLHAEFPENLRDKPIYFVFV